VGRNDTSANTPQKFNCPKATHFFCGGNIRRHFQVQMLVIERSLMLKPSLLLLDSLSLSSNYVDMVFEKLVDINKGGTSILLAEQTLQRPLKSATGVMCSRS